MKRALANAEGTGPHVVIIGGGFGGLSAARQLKRAPVRVTLIDRWNYHLFQPLLYQVATAGLSPADIAYPIRSVMRHQDNARILQAEVENVDLAARRVFLHDDTFVDYDYLVVATGARTNFFGHEATWPEHALGLKSIEDALEIRRRVLLAFETAEREPDADVRKALLTFVVIGGGPTGVEVAGALSDLARTVLAADFRVIDPTSTRVILIEMTDRLLPGGFDPKLSQKAKEQLEELGVEVRLRTTVKDITDRGVQLENEFVKAGIVLWTAGVKPRGLTQKLSVELDRSGRIIVGQDCSVPNHPEVFAIGDCARFIETGAAHPLPGVASVAIQQGRHVGKLIARAGRHQDKEREPFKYLDKGMMATIGRSRAVAQTGKIKLWGFIAWVAWLFVHLWFLIGVRNRIAVMMNWFWNYVTYRRGARLITGWRSWDWSEREHVLLPDKAAAAEAKKRAEPPPAPSPPRTDHDPSRPSQDAPRTTSLTPAR